MPGSSPPSDYLFCGPEREANLVGRDELSVSMASYVDRPKELIACRWRPSVMSPNRAILNLPRSEPQPSRRRQKVEIEIPQGKEYNKGDTERQLLSK
ncbi:hypothetical protein ACJ73_04843 [Blastomyces percursus]|uniref:Uncharacterized protein n=1 Tax=Blastomyces percursus TaxID=1658174 RepID=A0A1J9Q5J6_9EURO|nr:hypothetical protein ACJ73_04843 [Blastomyces percursus]